MGPRAQRCAAAALVASAACCLPAFAAAGPAAADTVFAAAWRADSWGGAAAGLACWLRDAEGALRLEILQAPEVPAGPGADARAPALVDLLGQRGRGWTVVLGGGDQGTWNAWGREWSAADPGLAAVLSAGLQELERGADRRDGIGDRTLRRAVRPAPAAGGDERRAFRRDMVRRGLGRGAAGEILTLRRSAGLAVLTSSRRPGKIRVGLPLGRLAVAPPAREVFAPLWTLGELLEFFPPGPGTWTAPAGFSAQ